MNRFQSWYSAQPRALRALLTINVVFYVAWVLLLSNLPVTYSFVRDHLALNPDLPGILFEPWQLLTYNFLHLSPGFWGFIHILFNLLWLYWIGRDYEDLHGPAPLLALYLLTGIGGGLLTVLLHATFPTAPFFGGPVHGASASVLGVMTAVAIQYPFKKIGLLFLGSIRLIYLVIAFLVLDLLFLRGSNTAVGAHLGGALFGLLIVKVEQRGLDLTSWAGFFLGGRKRRRPAPRRTGEHESLLERLESWLATRGKKDAAVGETAPGRLSKLRPLQTEEVVRPGTLEGEVDRILDKINEHGFDSLTDEEKRLLKEASRR